MMAVAPHGLHVRPVRNITSALGSRVDTQNALDYSRQGLETSLTMDAIKVEAPLTPPVQSPTRSIKSEPLGPYKLDVRSKRIKCGDYSRDGWIPSNGNSNMESLSPLSASYGYSLSANNLQSPDSTGASTASPSSSFLEGHEDSSPSSINTCDPDSALDLKKKKGPVPRQSEDLCLVCGDRASGYHYNALTCEGCKGFFRRSITKDTSYECKYGKNCEMDMYMRRKCQECRLTKCLRVGMRPECVVPEDQCRIKRQQKKAREKDKQKESKTVVHHEVIPIDDKKLVLHENTSLTKMEEDLINDLVENQIYYELPNNQNMTNIVEFLKYDLENNKRDIILQMTVKTVYLVIENSKTLLHFKSLTIDDQIILLKGVQLDECENGSGTETILKRTQDTVLLIVESTKRLHGFDTILRDDQITILKHCTSEVMMLRAARRYKPDLDAIIFANGEPYTRSKYYNSGMNPKYTDKLFSFCRHLSDLKVTDAEYALLVAICTFSERPGLLEPEKIEHIQEFYIDILRRYSVIRTPVRGKAAFGKLFNVLSELRELSELNNDQSYSFYKGDKQMPEFLVDVWSLDSFNGAKR